MRSFEYRAIKVTATGILLSLVLAGCAASGTGEQFVYRDPESTEAFIYHYRIDLGWRGSAAYWDVLSNETPLTRIGPGGFFIEASEPGPRSYKTKKGRDAGPIWYIDRVVWDAIDPTEYEDAIELHLEPGQSYFLRYDFVAGKENPRVESVAREVALGELEGMQAFPAIQESSDEQ